MEGTNLNSLLTEVSRVIANSDKTSINLESNLPITYQTKVQMYDGSERQPHLLNMGQQNNKTEPLPICTKNLLSQINNNYVAEEKKPTIARVRKRSLPNPPPGVRNLLANWEPHLLNRVPQEEVADPLPIFAKHLPSQTDPSYAAQEEKKPTSTRRSRKTSLPVVGYLSNWEPHLLDAGENVDRPAPLPTPTNYWLSKTDPSCEAQEENIPAVTRVRKTSLPSGGVKDYLQNLLSPEDLKKTAFQNRFPNYITDTSLSMMGMSITDSNFTASPSNAMRPVEKVLRMPFERQFM